MVFIFTTDSSIDCKYVLDSYFDERFRLRRALRASIQSSGFHACFFFFFGPRRALPASIQVREEFLSSSLTVLVFAFGL